jgi:hypothetical protein
MRKIRVLSVCPARASQSESGRAAATGNKRPSGRSGLGNGFVVERTRVAVWRRPMRAAPGNAKMAAGVESVPIVGRPVNEIAGAFVAIKLSAAAIRV